VTHVQSMILSRDRSGKNVVICLCGNCLAVSLQAVRVWVS
jgi:hypothetical protein